MTALKTRKSNIKVVASTIFKYVFFSYNKIMLVAIVQNPSC